jgi:hypothetical protein
LTPPVWGALFLAALAASCLRGAFPPVDLRAVCLVRALWEDEEGQNGFVVMTSAPVETATTTTNDDDGESPRWRGGV